MGRRISAIKHRTANCEYTRCPNIPLSNITGRKQNARTTFLHVAHHAIPARRFVHDQMQSGGAERALSLQPLRGEAVIIAIAEFHDQPPIETPAKVTREAATFDETTTLENVMLWAENFTHINPMEPLRANRGVLHRVGGGKAGLDTRAQLEYIVCLTA